MRQYYRVMAPATATPSARNAPSTTSTEPDREAADGVAGPSSTPAKGAGRDRPSARSDPRRGPGTRLQGPPRLQATRRLRLGPSLRDRLRRDRRPAAEPGEKPLWRRIGKWALIAAVAWFLLSVVLFAVSAQIQKGKLDDRAGDLLGGFPFLVASGQTILVIGTDARPEATATRRRPRRDRSASSRARPAFRSERRLPRVPRRHADARPSGRRRVREALDPPRHARRHPGPGAREDQRRLRGRGRRAADRDGRELPRDRDRPRRHPRLRGLRRLHRLDRRGPGQRSASTVKSQVDGGGASGRSRP